MRLHDGDRCRSYDAVIRVYDEAGNVIEPTKTLAILGRSVPFGRFWYCEPADAIDYVFQPITWCCDSRLRCSGQGDRNAQPRGRFQKEMVSSNEGSVLLLLVVYRLVCGALAFRTGFARADHAGFAIG